MLCLTFAFAAFLTITEIKEFSAEHVLPGGRVLSWPHLIPQEQEGRHPDAVPPGQAASDCP